MTHACNPGIWEAKARRLLQMEISLGSSIRVYFQREKKKEEESQQVVMVSVNCSQNYFHQRKTKAKLHLETNPATGRLPGNKCWSTSVTH